MNLPVKRIERYTRAGSAELGATPKVTEAVFSPDVIAGRELRTVELAAGQGGRAGRQVPPARATRSRSRKCVPKSSSLRGSRRPASSPPRARARSWRRWRKGAAWPARGAAGRGEAATAGSEAGSAARIPALPAEVRDAAFRAPLPAGKPRYGVATLANGDTALWTVTAVAEGPARHAKAADARQTAQDEARDRVAMSDATVYITAMRANSEIDVNPKLFE